MSAQAVESAPTQVMQGIVVPASAVDPAAFFKATRRLRYKMPQPSFDGYGTSSVTSLLQTGIVAGLDIRVAATLTTVDGTGAVATTTRWPYDLIKRLRISANGQSNLINTSGWKLKVRELLASDNLDDRGVVRAIGGTGAGTSRTQGTLSLNSESWGAPQAATGITAAAYTVDLYFHVPIAYDPRTLVGAIFAQTASTDLQVVIDWANQSDLFTLTGTASAALTNVSVTCEGVVFSIPEVSGQIVIPDLSAFHSLIETRTGGLVNGVNELRLSGQGVGRQLMRVYGQTWNGATSAPLAVNATNYGQMGWRYGGNDTPEVHDNGALLRSDNEREFGADFGTYQGFWIHDWAKQHAFRDSIDEGAATDLRILMEIPTGVTLTSAYTEYVQEVLFSAAAGA